MLAADLAALRPAALYTSPLLRARQTARAIAETTGLRPRQARAFKELDYGAWTGRAIEALDATPAWRAYNADRERGATPNGESLVVLRGRVAEGLHRIARRHPGIIVVVVTHSEPMRAALSAVTGLTLDEVLAYDPAPARVWVVDLASSRVWL